MADQVLYLVCSVVGEAVEDGVGHELVVILLGLIRHTE